MKESNEFPVVGKDTPYKVPADFFDTITEKTLLKAKGREVVRIKRMQLWRNISVAASIAALLFIGSYVMQFSDKISKPDVAVLETEKALKPEGTNNQSAENKDIAKTEIPSLAENMPDKALQQPNNSEHLSDVLSDMTDEELLGMASILKTDPFINEPEQ